MSTRLITMKPEAIIDFCLEHPVDLMPAWDDVTRRGGTGDVRPPTPAVDAFYKLFLNENKGRTLPTQAEYVAYCRDLWHSWYDHYLTPYVQQCFEARLCRNFYPSLIDSIHVWALLGTRYSINGHLVFDQCLLDTYEDVIRNSDLLVYRGADCLRIALASDTRRAREDAMFKSVHRQPREMPRTDPFVRLYLPIDARARRGGKCWFQWPHHFRPLFRKVEQLWLPGLQPDQWNDQE